MRLGRKSHETETNIPSGYCLGNVLMNYCTYNKKVSLETSESWKNEGSNVKVFTEPYSQEFDGEFNLAAVGIETTKSKSANISHTMHNDVMFLVALLALSSAPLCELYV